jgi:hypothetical protein
MSRCLGRRRMTSTRSWCACVQGHCERHQAGCDDPLLCARSLAVSVPSLGTLGVLALVLYGLALFETATSREFGVNSVRVRSRRTRCRFTQPRRSMEFSNAGTEHVRLASCLRRKLVSLLREAREGSSRNATSRIGGCVGHGLARRWGSCCSQCSRTRDRIESLLWHTPHRRRSPGALPGAQAGTGYSEQ